MATRIASAVLWFVAMSWAANLASTFLHFAAGIGYVVALAIAAFIAVDPLNVMWRVPLGDAAAIDGSRATLDPARKDS